mmetsp:Transcript_18608/g.42683  ORF Transcript_18608/g.42683 Transcript_18608/m.42683 type:complete len:254 (-) Transcript_18608:62-823(-)
MRAQGHAMTSMTSPFMDQALPASAPQTHGTVHMRRARMTTTGVYTLANSSTSCSVSLRFDWASSIRRMRRATAESFVVEVVLTTSSAAPLLTVPPDTAEPGPLETGRLSPVKLDSSTVDFPSRTTPSQGTLSPGRTLTVVPSATADAGTTTRSLVTGFTMLAVTGLSCTMALSASLALAVALPSRASLIANRNVTAAASVYSPRATAPAAARNMRQFTSSCPRIAVLRALSATGGRPAATERRAAYLARPRGG